MQIGGYNPNSFIDYPEKIAAVIFFGGCNLDCWYCHNRFLLESEEYLDLNEILKKIEKRKSFLEGVVLSGGEPTLQNFDKLVALIASIKDMGLLVKLDTNGLNPNMLSRLLPYLDYVAMDIKAPLDKYSLATPIQDSGILKIKKSIDIIKTFKGEFRTTVVPKLDINDIEAIAKLIGNPPPTGKVSYYLQQLIPPKKYSDIRVHSSQTIRDMMEVANKYIPTQTRGI